MTRPVPTFPLRRRHRAIVEPRDDAIGWTRLERAVPEDVRGGEVAAARRLEDLEHGMAVIEVAERAAAAGRAIDGRAQAAGQQIRFALRPRRVLAHHDQQAAAALDEPLEHAAAAGRRKHRVVQDDDGVLVDRRRRHPHRRRVVHLEGGRRADRQRLGQKQARIGAIAVVHDHERDRRARRQHEVERVVGRQRIRSGAHRAAHVRPASVNCVKDTEPEACAATVACSVWISWPSMVSVTGTSFSGASPLLLRPAVTVMRSWPENDGAAERHRRHGKVRGVRRSDRHGADRHAVGEAHFFRSAPAGVLEIADQHRLAALERRPAEDAFRELQRGAVARRARSHARRVDRAPRAACGPRWRACSLRRCARRARASRGRRRRGPARPRAPRPRAIPVVAVAHARRLIEQDDDLARAAADRRGRGALCRRNGRANAATMSAMAAARSSSSTQWRIRRRRTDWYGIRRTNISDGNSMTRFRSR